MDRLGVLLFQRRRHASHEHEELERRQSRLVSLVWRAAAAGEHVQSELKQVGNSWQRLR